MNGPGRSLIILGLLLVFIGAAVIAASKIPWLGRLPGDIVVKKGNFSFYFPLATCLLLSALISLVLWFFRR